MNILKASIGVSVLSFSLLMSSTIPALASSDLSNNNVPQEVMNKINAEVKLNENKPIKVEAWEEDLNGVKVKVKPLSERSKGFNQNNSTLIGTYGVPADGYTYVPEGYFVSNPSPNYKYKVAGVMRMENKSSTLTLKDVTYTQQSTVENFWNVGLSISGNATFKTSFLGKLAVTMGGTYDKSKKYSTGTTYSTKVDIPPKTIAYLTNYTVGMYDKGTVRWKKYTKSGTLVGYYSESAGGTAVSKSSINIVLSDTDPY